MPRTSVMRCTPVALCAAALFTIAARSAFAALGETEEEINKRYGAPAVRRSEGRRLAPAEEVLIWDTPHGLMSASFMGGKSHREVYLIKDGIAGMDDPAVAAILEANAAGGEWQVNDGAKAAYNMKQGMRNQPNRARYYWVQSGRRAVVSEQKENANHLDVFTVEWQDTLDDMVGR
jgi:hypothetical protein